MNDFDDDFDNFEDNNFDDFNQKGSLKETWQNNPLLKIFTIIAGIILVIAAIIIFGGQAEDQKSTVNQGLDKRETLGGELSPNYTEAIEDVNRQRFEQAVKTGSSTIPMLVNPEEQELLTADEELPPFQDFDPLKTFRNAVAPEEEPVVTKEEPVLIEPQEIFTPQAQQPAAPAPSPEAIQALAQAMSVSVGNILGNHNPEAARITQVTPESFLDPVAINPDGSQSQLIDTNGDGIPDTPLNNDLFAQTDNDIDDFEEDVIVETILIPSGTINYAQILIEANSDTPGPVLAQLVSGPLRGARLIGQFTVQEKVLVLNFSSIVIDGINQPIDAVAIDPNTTVPGIATDVDNRYFTRVILPAAARFLEGVGSAIAQDTETTVTVSGDTVIEEQDSLDFEQELGRGVEEAFTEIADFLDEDADSVQRLIRVQRGTPVGVFFTEPVFRGTIIMDEDKNIEAYDETSPSDETVEIDTVAVEDEIFSDDDPLMTDDMSDDDFDDNLSFDDDANIDIEDFESFDEIDYSKPIEKSGPNWFNIGIIGVVIIAIAAIIYTSFPNLLDGGVQKQPQTTTKQQLQPAQQNDAVATQPSLFDDPSILGGDTDNSVSSNAQDTDIKDLFEAVENTPTISDQEIEDLFAAIPDASQQIPTPPVEDNNIPDLSNDTLPMPSDIDTPQMIDEIPEQAAITPVTNDQVSALNNRIDNMNQSMESFMERLENRIDTLQIPSPQSEITSVDYSNEINQLQQTITRLENRLDDMATQQQVVVPTPQPAAPVETPLVIIEEPLHNKNQQMF